MNFLTQHSSSVVRSTEHGMVTAPRINTRLIFEHRAVPHKYCSPTAAVRSVDAEGRSFNGHRDVSTRFGQRLRQLRTERNLTQVRMAREFGLDRSYISDLERGRKSISLPTMEIFALGLKLSLAELLSGI